MIFTTLINPKPLRLNQITDPVKAITLLYFYYYNKSLYTFNDILSYIFNNNRFNNQTYL